MRDPDRLAALRSTRLLDTPAEAAYDRLTRLATNLLNAPVAQVSLIDEDRQFFKSAQGMDEPWASARETPLSHSICQHAVDARVPLVIEDARVHPRGLRQPRDPRAQRRRLRRHPAHHRRGPRPRHALRDRPQAACVDREQIETLETLAAAVLAQIELRAARVPSDE